jgi:hypothetical protein
VPNCSPVMYLSSMVRLQKVAGNAYAAFCGGPESNSSPVPALPALAGVIPIDGSEGAKFWLSVLYLTLPRGPAATLSVYPIGYRTRSFTTVS